MLFVHCTKNSIKRFLTASAKVPKARLLEFVKCFVRVHRALVMSRRQQGETRMIGRRWLAIWFVMAGAVAAGCGGKKDEGGGTKKAIVGGTHKTAGEGPPKRAAPPLQKPPPTHHQNRDCQTDPPANRIHPAP